MNTFALKADGFEKLKGSFKVKKTFLAPKFPKCLELISKRIDTFPV
jgi:hypothetical protein